MVFQIYCHICDFQFIGNLEYKEKEVEVWNHVENMHGLLQFLA